MRFILIRIWFFARPLVLSAARVKENWFSLSLITDPTSHMWRRGSTGSLCRGRVFRCCVRWDGHAGRGGLPHESNSTGVRSSQHSAICTPHSAFGKRSSFKVSAARARAMVGCFRRARREGERRNSVNSENRHLLVIPFPADRREHRQSVRGWSGRWIVPDGKVTQDILDHPRVVNEGDYAHGVLAHGAAQRIHMPDPRNQVAGGGMGMRGRAVCHIMLALA